MKECFGLVDLPVDVECNMMIDQVIESRRSIRKFKMEAPSRELIEQVLKAGLQAHTLRQACQERTLEDS